ncbi:hypothetical protein [Streptomyces sp. NPDC002845]
MNSQTVISVAFNRSVRANGLRPGDVFTFPDAPHTPLTVAAVDKTALSHELTLVTLTVTGRDQPLSLPANTAVRALRMLRTVSMTCLLCGTHEDLELDLPRDGEPLSFVCANHTSDYSGEEDSGSVPTPEAE